MTKVMCSVCGAGKAKLVKRSYRATYNGEAVEVPSIEMFRCEDCGEEFFNPEQARNLSVAVKNAVRKQLGLLPPEKIVAIREKLGLTQQHLEDKALIKSLTNSPKCDRIKSENRRKYANRTFK